MAIHFINVKKCIAALIAGLHVPFCTKHTPNNDLSRSLQSQSCNPLEGDFSLKTLAAITVLSEISDSHGGEYEDSCLLVN
jgi:hypothetical protein